jgi:Family of unknown function (DUF6011)
MPTFNGTFTVQNPNTNGFKTYRLSQPEKFQGRTIAALKGFGQFEFGGFATLQQNGTFRAWKSAEGMQNHADFLSRILPLLNGAVDTLQEEIYLEVPVEGGQPLQIRGVRACGRCGRRLTNPLSLERGIGPECWEKMGY